MKIYNNQSNHLTTREMTTLEHQRDPNVMDVLQTSKQRCVLYKGKTYMAIKGLTTETSF